jgi:hypothetical protein
LNYQLVVVVYGDCYYYILLDDGILLHYKTHNYKLRKFENFAILRCKNRGKNEMAFRIPTVDIHTVTTSIYIDDCDATHSEARSDDGTFVGSRQK